MSQQIYIHYDSVSNHILSSGIPFSFSQEDASLIPKNILLLNGRSSLAAYDNFSGFPCIKGRDKVQEFLSNQKHSLEEQLNWIDFESIDFLHQLIPQEIADLLYISHAKSHLHSPFFYKLQNNYINLSMDNQFTKVYYRKIDHFLLLLAQALTDVMTELVNRQNRRLFFNKHIDLAPLKVDTLQELMPYLKEGIVIASQQAEVTEDTYYLPIFLAEDHYHYVPESYDADNKLGAVVYHADSDTWSLDMTEGPLLTYLS